jgi:hypothetical protein
MKLTNRNLKVSELTLNWCIENLGNPLKTKSPYVTIITDRRIKNVYGYYSDQEITLNINAITSVKQLISTIIHEYTHFLQSPRTSYFKKYWKMNDKVGYIRNPYEIEARLTEQAYTNEVYNYIKTKI